MFEIRQDTPEGQLASGFAKHVECWAASAGAPPESVKSVAWIAQQLSLANSSGHVCLLLDDILTLSDAIDLANERALLLASGVVGTPENPGVMPIILDKGNRLYLHRYFDYERRLAQRLLRAQAQPFDLKEGKQVLQRRLTELFAANAEHLGNAPDWQKLATALALRNRLTIISGGPGTGKTTMVVNLLACLLAYDPENRIVLAAPTGKAAARMEETIRESAEHLPEAVRNRLPAESFTVHRLLGVTSQAGVFIHHAHHPLALDTLIIDEASMLDLALATKLFEAVPESSRIILLGDKDQLAAVESGAVFAELCQNPALSESCRMELTALSSTPIDCIRPPPSTQAPSLKDTVVWFSRNYRFSHDSGIGKLASLINGGETSALLAWLSTQEDPAIRWLNDGNGTLSADTRQCLFEGYAAYIDAVNAGPTDYPSVSKAFGQFRVLCGVREGPRGTYAINAELSLRMRSRIKCDAVTHGPDWYIGRPIIVRRNDYVLKLFNGDIGIALPDASGELKVYFPKPDGTPQGIPPMRLPEHETAFALTVHKSQGSEFDEVLVLLPESTSRILTRELLYTGITRAREKVTLCAGKESIQTAVGTRIQRRSGLLEQFEINNLSR